MFTDEVVCIDASDNERLTQYQVYPFLGYKKSKGCGCSFGYVDVGLPPINKYNHLLRAGETVRCLDCNKSFVHDGVGWFKAYRFAPIDSVDISEALEVLEKDAFTV